MIKVSKKYMTNLKMLYGAQDAMSNTNGAPQPRRKPKFAKRSQGPSEANIQIALIKWAQSKGIDLIHIANEGRRTPWEGYKLRMMGMAPGIPDLLLPIPSNGYAALWIELKANDKCKLSEHQKEWIDKLNSFGNFATVAYGFDQAQQIIIKYLNNGDLS